jgi:Uma2 family endonuclease
MYVEAEVVETTSYETERGKPIPSKLPSRIQTRLTAFLVFHYSKRFETFTELTLDTPSEKSTPDIALCQIEPVDFSCDEIKQKDPLLATIEILSPTQILQTLLNKTNEYFAFGVKSCWVVLPALKSIYVFSAPNQFEVYSHGEELVDTHLDIRMPIDEIFAEK